MKRALFVLVVAAPLWAQAAPRGKRDTAPAKLAPADAPLYVDSKDAPPTTKDRPTRRLALKK